MAKKKSKKYQEIILYILKDIFIDGMTGMSYGLFTTLIVGIICAKFGEFIGGNVGGFLSNMGYMFQTLTGAGVGVGMAYHYKEKSLTILSAGVCGMLGSNASNILAGSVFVNDHVVLFGAGEPLGAFVAAYVGIKIGRLITGKTEFDILLTPIISVSAGGAAGFLVGPYISNFMLWIGKLIMWATEEQPLIMGIVISVVMGMMITLPISAVVLGVILNLTGLAAGAATVGCCCNMIGFAVASFHENRWSGLITQGLGTSMMQFQNILKKPIVWLPSIIASAVLGPVSTVVLEMTNNATGSGMGSAGLVGQILTYQTMVSEGYHGIMVLIEIIVMHFIAPGVIAFAVSEILRKRGAIKEGDLKLPEKSE